MKILPPIKVFFSSSLVCFVKTLWWVLIINDYDIGINLDVDTMRAVYEKFGLEPGTQDFIGHAMALYLDDECAQCLCQPEMIINQLFQLH
jgi:GDP dissociation inhibitor